MASTAKHSELGLLDLTESEIGEVPTWWPQVHRAKPPLTCRTCSGPMTAVQNLNNRWRKRFFKHLAAEQVAPDCWLRSTESEEHYFLKHELAQRIREFPGWEAEVEVAGENWRADVLAVADGGRRIAWEIQLSPVSTSEVERRTARYAAEGIEVCWVADRHSGWFGAVPSLLIQPGKHFGKTVVNGLRELMPEPLRKLSGVDTTTVTFRELGPLPGHVKQDRDRLMPWWTWASLCHFTVMPRYPVLTKPFPFPAADRWRCEVVWGFRGSRSLRSVLKGILDGSLHAVALGGPFREYTRDAGWNSTPVVWASRSDLAAARKLLAFAAGWRVLGQPGLTCEDCGSEDLVLLHGDGQFQRRLCPVCDEDLHHLVVGVHEDPRRPCGTGARRRRTRGAGRSGKCGRVRRLRRRRRAAARGRTAGTGTAAGSGGTCLSSGLA
jgi:hypothetical protein